MLKYFRNTLYVRLEPERIRVLHVESGREIEDIPVLAIETRKGKQIIVAAGHEALSLSGRPNIQLSNGFRHPRTLLADFAVAEQTLKHFVKQALPKSWFSAAPIIVMHPLAVLEGGLTQIEGRAFRELAAMSGGGQIYVWTGPELTTDELAGLRFSRTGGQLAS